MAGLMADQLSEEFLKSFLPETIFLVSDEEQVSAPVPVVPPVPDPELVSKVEAPLRATPEIPKLENDNTTIASGKYVVTGENKKGVVILVTLPNAKFKELPKLELLQKMLSSIGFNPEDVAYVNNISGELSTFEELQQLLQVNYIISFASRISTALPHAKFTLYNPVKIGDVPVVFSQSLEVLEQDIDHKKQLWNVFQQVFL
jgi:hypothetical protein